MYIERLIDKELLAWKNASTHKPLSLENFGKLTVKDEANGEERQISILPLYAISNLQH